MKFIQKLRSSIISPTPVKTLKEAQRIALDEGIKHVYLGNV